MKFLAYPDRDMLTLGLADRIARDLADFLRREGKATLALPGGTTPGPVFDVLCDIDLDWADVTVVPTDERWVSEDSPRSNMGLLRDRLLIRKAAAARLLPLYLPGTTPDVALPALISALSPHLPLSILLLGMGADMHTASLFPGADRLDAALASDAPPLIALRAPGTGEARVSLTAPVLRGAMNIHLLITGADKRAALERAQTRPPDQAPVRAVLANATVHWAE